MRNAKRTNAKCGMPNATHNNNHNNKQQRRQTNNNNNNNNELSIHQLQQWNGTQPTPRSLKKTIATVNGEEASFVALKLHIIVVCGMGSWCFCVFGTHCIRCGALGGRCRTCCNSFCRRDAAGQSWRPHSRGSSGSRRSEHMLDENFHTAFTSEDSNNDGDSSVIATYRRV